MMKDPFESWGYGDWANLKLFDEKGQIITPYPDLNKPEHAFTPSPVDDEEEEDK